MVATTFSHPLFSVLVVWVVIIPSEGIDSNLEVLQTINFVDNDGHEYEEFAFRAPVYGIPDNIVNLYCTNVKNRLYWEVFRAQIKDEKRSGIYLRRIARFARNLFPEIRDVDNPFNQTRLSKVDDFLGVDDPMMSKLAQSKKDTLNRLKALDQQSQASDGKELITLDKGYGSIEESDITHNELNHSGSSSSTSKFQTFKLKTHKIALKIKAHLQEWLPKVGVGLYTRFLTMWWLMMPCLFVKYYLWDPALDEFVRLQRSLVMYPHLQLLKLHELECKPVQFFKRLLETCKILNPLMNIDFGQFSLEKLTRFESDVKATL